MEKNEIKENDKQECHEKQFKMNIEQNEIIKKDKRNAINNKEIPK